MLKATLLRDLEITIESALMLSPDVPTAALAERIYDSDPELMERIQRTWVIERLVWMINRRRSRVSQGNQLPLPGFEKLPRRMVIKGGKRVALRYATVKQLRQYRGALWKKRDSRIEVVDRLIELVAGYASEHPGITVEEVMQRELDKLQGPR